jgi:hypothetical protein
VLAALTALGCSREGGRTGTVARVGSAELSREELSNARAGSRHYINDWIVAELLYQEAARRGLTETDAVKRQVNQARKRLAIEALLEQDVYAEDSAAVEPAAVAAYFAASGSSFTLNEDIVHASYVLFGGRDDANAFRTAVLRGTPWDSVLASVRQDSVRKVLQVATRQYFTRATLYPDELWKLARTLGREEVSFVVKTAGGFYVVKAHSVKRQGEQPDLDYVKNEIRARILIGRRRERYDNLIAALRAKHASDIRISIPDTGLSAGE